MPDVLIITNGDSAAELLHEVGFGPVVLPWRDCLHEGPVPLTSTLYELSEIRAEYLASTYPIDAATVGQSFFERDETLSQAAKFNQVTLWFEHDLYDQLQLIQVLDWLSQRDGMPEIWLVQSDDYIGHQEPSSIVKLERTKTKITVSQSTLAAKAWQAFRENTPLTWADLLRQDLSPLPYLANAVLRLLQELPNSTQGLSRTECQLLKSVRAGYDRPPALFKDAQRHEEAKFLGDWGFWNILDSLRNAATPPVEFLSSEKDVLHFHDESQSDYFNTPLKLTAFGTALLEGNVDYLETNSIDRWFGGTHLTNGNIWRWDSNERKLVAPI